MNHLFDRMDNVLLATIYLGTNDAEIHVDLELGNLELPEQEEVEKENAV